MLKNTQRRKLHLLLKKYIDGTAGKKEAAFVEEYYRYFDYKEDISNNISLTERQELEERMLENIHLRVGQEGQRPPIPFYKTQFFRAAAAVLIIIAGSFFFLYKNHHKVPVSGPVALQHDIQAGTNGAILKLANGKTILLDTVKNGSQWHGSHGSIIKTDSAVAFIAAGHQGDVEYNTLITPSAREEQLTLTDGTKVWLNAESSIRFPTSFSGKQRVVEVTGEAYFEVAENPSHPFIVKVNDIQIKVLGTHFNVMAYNEEPTVNTTLVEGAVSVSTGKEKVILSSGQQSVMSRHSDKIEVSKADTSEALAWKNGLFRFNNTGLEAIMRQISRWYNVTITYRGTIPDRTFTGTVSRNVNLNHILEVLKLSNVHFKMEGREIIVSR